MLLGSLLILLFTLGCTTRPGTPATPRVGDEIVVAGQFFHTGTPVVLWIDEGGYDAYRVEKRFAPRGQHDWDSIKDNIQTPNRYGTRFERSMTDEEFHQHRHGQWTLDELQQRIDLFVLHYDVCGTSRRCFEILHDHRCLSVHFMVAVDGTIYQSLDLKERAWHAGIANDRSVGIEIANIGAYPPAVAAQTLDKWYEHTPGQTRLILPAKELAALRSPGFVGFADRPGLVTGSIHGRELAMVDLTPQQYEALAKLSAALSRIFPKLPLDYPRDDAGQVLTRVLTPQELADHRGLIGHYHLTTDKTDPGPAVQWDKIITRARETLGTDRDVVSASQPGRRYHPRVVPHPPTDPEITP